jgi:hypothetical protein
MAYKHTLIVNRSLTTPRKLWIDRHVTSSSHILLGVTSLSIQNFLTIGATYTGTDRLSKSTLPLTMNVGHW